VEALATAIKPNWRILEVGAGRSTPWFAARAEKLVSLEADPNWYATVQRNLAATGLTHRVDLRLVSAEVLPKILKEMPPATFDLVLVDGPEPRVPCVEAARAAVVPGGLFVLDNADRPSYRPADDLLTAWSVTRYVGMPPPHFTTMETAVYRRPQSD
jgi:predicted O-methyltransferase YrrM